MIAWLQIELASTSAKETRLIKISSKPLKHTTMQMQ